MSYLGSNILPSDNPRARLKAIFYGIHSDSWPCQSHISHVPHIFWWVILSQQRLPAEGELCRPWVEAQKPFQQGGNIFSLSNITNLLVTLPPIYIFIHAFIYSRDFYWQCAGKETAQILYRQTDLGVKPRQEPPPPGEPPARTRRWQGNNQLASLIFSVPS